MRFLIVLLIFFGWTFSVYSEEPSKEPLPLKNIIVITADGTRPLWIRHAEFSGTELDFFVSYQLNINLEEDELKLKNMSLVLNDKTIDFDISLLQNVDKVDLNTLDFSLVALGHSDDSGYTGSFSINLKFGDPEENCRIRHQKGRFNSTDPRPILHMALFDNGEIMWLKYVLNEDCRYQIVDSNYDTGS